MDFKIGLDMKFITAILVLFSLSAMAGLPPTTGKGIGDTSDLTTFKFQFPNMTVSHAGTTAVFGGGLTTTQKNALTATAGMFVYDSTLNLYSTYNGSTWLTFTASADTDWTACTFSTLAWQGLGTVTNTSLQCRRQGPNLEIKGTVTLGTVAASLAQFLLPNNYGIITTQSPGSAESYGSLLRNTAATAVLINAISTSALGYFQVSNNLISSTVNPSTAVNGSAAFGTGDVVEFQNIKIPITGWSVNSGPLTGIIQTPGGGTFDHFSASFGTTAVTTVCSASPCSYLDQIGTGLSSVTRTGAGLYTLNFARTYLKAKCIVQGSTATQSAGVGLSSASCVSCSTLSFTARDSNSTQDIYGNIVCDGSY